MDEAADEIIRRHGFDGEDRPEIAFGLVQARIKMLEARLRRLQGMDSSDVDYVSPHLPEVIAPESRPEIVSPGPQSPNLSECLPAFLDYARTIKQWRGQTEAQTRASGADTRRLCFRNLFVDEEDLKIGKIIEEF